jgi:hypothetical protein
MNENTKKIFLGIFILSCLAIALIVFLNKPSSKKPSETFTMTNSSNNLLLSDNKGNMSTYATQNSSILLTDDSGQLKSLPFPKGLIMIWYNPGSTNPTNANLSPGWSLCDGSNGTPDLRGRFVLGCGQGTGLTNRVINETPGGEETHTLSTTEMPSHDHKFNARWDTSGAGGDIFMSSGWNNQAVTEVPSHNVQIGKAGGDTNGNTTPHNNMPPYYVLCYICYTGVGL